jgi:antitoxin component HigA of HigAB toxin-antitoxin module
MQRPGGRSPRAFSHGTTFFSNYENEHHRPEPLPDHEILAHLMREHGLTQKGLERETGIADSTISDVLRGHRQLTRAPIGTLARFFRVRPRRFNNSDAIDRHAYAESSSSLRDTFAPRSLAK